eukprot:CAMPEP_0117681028 /NCGR_PEP_ID=MMETSP0804-20121206/18720_1 /TAXON_ID=1074897 /ORGANISM="Tetraselmis astigmatica, Strain CCMP880" /LENGTH=58 /DNA_ID=CAMNT_0005490671 /DNA_START=42 /DNA_END=215 /DNA_ORIENTATION=-
MWEKASRGRDGWLAFLQHHEGGKHGEPKGRALLCRPGGGSHTQMRACRARGARLCVAS